jgi:predicted aminopeptidase
VRKIIPPSFWPRFLQAGVCALLFAVNSGCSSIRYYSHLAQGQWSLWSQREPIDGLLKQESTHGDLRARLEQVLAVRQFATAELGLADNDSYRYYTDLKRPYAVWNVFAAPAFSTAPTQWCFPIAGCVSYRGYFNEESARQFADQLQSQGLDTYVAGVAAYSTLGWFDDPVLNTFLYNDDTRLAGLIFHELAHQQLYLAGDTEFNESFARSVEIAGVKRWLQSRNQASLIAQYQQRLKMQTDFVQTVLSLQADLAALYQQGFSESEMQSAKAQAIEVFQQQQYSNFKARWNGYAGYDDWVTGQSNNNASQPPQHAAAVLNNAKLNTVSSYHRWLPAFEQLLMDSDGDFGEFYRQAKKLSKLNDNERRKALEQIKTRAK